MKKFLFIVCAFWLNATVSFGQSISYPKVDRNTATGLGVMEILWLKSATVVHFFYCDTVRYENQEPYIFLARPGTAGAMFIRSGGKSYKLLKTEGIANKPNQMYVEYRRIYDFYAYFETVPYQNEIIDIIEGVQDGWNLYGIHFSSSGGESSDNNHYSTVNMTKEGGVYFIPCKVNGLPLKFVFDTGASDVSLSMTEAIFMLKNGFLKKEGIGNKSYYQTASGDIVAGTKVVINKLEIGEKILYNVEASITNSTNAPLLLGQSALSKIGRFEFDYNKNIIKFYEKK